MTTIEFQIIEAARQWHPSRITADEIATKLYGFPSSPGAAQGIAQRVRALVRRGLMTAEPANGFTFYALTPKAMEIVDA